MQNGLLGVSAYLILNENPLVAKGSKVNIIIESQFEELLAVGATG